MSVCVTHVQAGVVGEQAVITQSNVLLLPLLVEGFTTSFHQHALQETEDISNEVFLFWIKFLLLKTN